MLYLSRFAFPDWDDDYQFRLDLKRTCYNSIYPFFVLSERGLTEVEFAPVTVFYGGNGSGKTTLLRCLNFLTAPDGGRILVNGETLFDAADPSARRESEILRKRLHFGLVFQNFNLFPQYTARS